MYVPCILLPPVDLRDLTRTANHSEWSLECSTYYHTPPVPFPSHLQFLCGQYPIMPSKLPYVLPVIFPLPWKKKRIYLTNFANFQFLLATRCNIWSQVRVFFVLLQIPFWISKGMRNCRAHSLVCLSCFLFNVHCDTLKKLLNILFR